MQNREKEISGPFHLGKKKLPWKWPVACFFVPPPLAYVKKKLVPHCLQEKNCGPPLALGKNSGPPSVEEHPSRINNESVWG